MKYHFIQYRHVRDKIVEMVEANKQDFAENYGEVNADYAYFDQLALMGLAYVTIALEDDQIAGFAGFAINKNTTHDGLEAENIVMYFRPEYRGKYFKEMLQYSKEQLAKNGVPKITATIKSNKLSKALQMNGFKKTYEVWELDCG